MGPRIQVLDIASTGKESRAVKHQKQTASTQTAKTPKVENAACRLVLLPYNPLRAWSRNGERHVQRTSRMAPAVA